MTIEGPQRQPLSPVAVWSWMSALAVAASEIQQYEAAMTELVSAVVEMIMNPADGRLEAN